MGDIEINKVEISENEIKKYLNTSLFGNKISVFKTIESTNTFLKENDCVDGEIVVASHQSGGKGTKGRSFISNENQGIFFSFVIKSNMDLTRLSTVTIAVAVSVTRALKKVCAFEADLKWVNDIFYNNKKLGGILTEARFENIQKLDKLIIGIGLNTGIVPEEITNIATSIEAITKKSLNKNELIGEILNNFEKIYKGDFEKNFESVLNEYKTRLFILNKDVMVEGVDNFKAVVVDVNKNGELVVKDENNKIRVLTSGDISIRF